MKLSLDSSNLKDREALQRKFGKRLAELRDKKGISQEKFSFEVGVDRTYISYIERGKRNPSLYMLWKIAKTLGVNLSTLTNSL